MPDIKNDSDFRQALAGLGIGEQRKLGCLFIEPLLSLTEDDRIARTLEVARRGGDEEEMATAALTVKRAVIDSHTRCGKEGDWADQASYFIARAAAACVASEAHSVSGPLAWQAAMGCRMARMSESMLADEDKSGMETERQYKIADQFLTEGKGDQS